jgi:PPOX class probable F420-dependent enzyme
MPATSVPPSVDRFLAEPNVAVVATLRPDGAPHTAATWYDWEDGRVLLSMDDSRLRLSFLEHDPRLALTVMHRDDWYQHVSLLGAVEEMYADEGLADVDRLAQRYLGTPYPTRDSLRTTAWVRVESWHGWDASGARKRTHAKWEDS